MRTDRERPNRICEAKPVAEHSDRSRILPSGRRVSPTWLHLVTAPHPGAGPALTPDTEPRSPPVQTRIDRRARRLTRSTIPAINTEASILRTATWTSNVPTLKGKRPKEQEAWSRPVFRAQTGGSEERADKEFERLGGWSVCILRPQHPSCSHRCFTWRRPTAGGDGSIIGSNRPGRSQHP